MAAKAASAREREAGSQQAGSSSMAGSSGAAAGALVARYVFTVYRLDSSIAITHPKQEVCCLCV